MKTLAILFLIVLPMLLWGQTPSGYVRAIAEDDSNGERLVGAHLYNVSTQKGTASNSYGYLTFHASTGDTLRVSYIGYNTVAFVVNDSILNNLNVFRLKPHVELLAVDVYSNHKKNELQQPGRLGISVQSIQKLPVFLSEPDVFKTLQLTPGVQVGTEGTSNIFVRGGDPGQNMVVIDDVPVYNTNHLLGFFSVVNSDAIKSCDIYKSGFPAKFGGRASSVVDLVLYDGNNQRTTGSAEMGILLGKFQFEGPLVKGKSSFNVAARRTFIDLFTYPISKLSGNGGMGYHFGDLNAKANYTFDLKNRIYVNFYYGNDKANVSEKSNKNEIKQANSQAIAWGNTVASFRWSHLFARNAFVNTTLYHSSYHYGTQIKESYKSEAISENFDYKYRSGIRDFGVRSDFEMPIFERFQFKMGVSSVIHQFNSGSHSYNGTRIDAETDFFVPDSLVHQSSASESTAYLELSGTLFPGLQIMLGGHSNYFSYEQKGFATFEPRAVLSYALSPRFSIHSSYTQMGQNIHLLTNASIGMPTDYWIPAQKKLGPEKAIQWAVGASWDVPEYRITVDAYEKQLENLITYIDGTSFMQNPADQLERIVSGTGSSRGIETFIEKKKGRLTGWVSYTLSKTDRHFETINQGKPFPFDYDRRHNLAITGMYQLKKNIHVSAAWVYMSGFHVTLPTQSVLVLSDLTEKSSIEVDYVDKRNNFQTPPYHRLDVSISFDKQKKRGTRTWKAGLYNAYNRQNPFYISIENEYNPDTHSYGSSQIQQKSLFPIIPSVSYAFKFK